MRGHRRGSGERGGKKSSEDVVEVAQHLTTPPSSDPLLPGPIRRTLVPTDIDDSKRRSSIDTGQEDDVNICEEYTD